MKARSKTGECQTKVALRIKGTNGGLPMIRPLVATSAFYKGESQGKKQLRRLEEAKMFAALSSPSHVERLWGIRSS
jgi:hypothetical protein